MVSLGGDAFIQRYIRDIGAGIRKPQLTVLARTNARLFELACLCAEVSSFGRGVTYHTFGADANKFIQVLRCF